MGSFFVYSDNICLSDSHRLLSIISFVGFHFQLGSKLISSFHSLSLSHTLTLSLSLFLFLIRFFLIYEEDPPRFLLSPSCSSFTYASTSLGIRIHPRHLRRRLHCDEIILRSILSILIASTTLMISDFLPPPPPRPSPSSLSPSPPP